MTSVVCGAATAVAALFVALAVPTVPVGASIPTAVGRVAAMAHRAGAVTAFPSPEKLLTGVECAAEMALHAADAMVWPTLAPSWIAAVFAVGGIETLTRVLAVRLRLQSALLLLPANRRPSVHHYVWLMVRHALAVTEFSIGVYIFSTGLVNRKLE